MFDSHFRLLALCLCIGNAACILAKPAGAETPQAR